MRRAGAMLVVAVTALVVGACGGGDNEPTGAGTSAPPGTTEPPAATETPATTSEPTVAPTPEAASTEPASDAELVSEERVLDDYRQARDAYRAAYNPPDPAHAGLLAWYDGRALEGTQAELEGLIAEGHSEVIEYEYHPEIEAFDPGGAAIVRDCFNGNVQTIDTETGEDIGEPNVYTRPVTYTLTLTEDRWMIVSGQTQEGSCTPED